MDSLARLRALVRNWQFETINSTHLLPLRALTHREAARERDSAFVLGRLGMLE